MGPIKKQKKLTAKNSKSAAVDKVLKDESTKDRKIWDKSCDKEIEDIKKDAIKYGNVSIHICVDTGKGIISQLYTHHIDITLVIASLLSTVNEKSSSGAQAGILKFISNLK